MKNKALIGAFILSMSILTVAISAHVVDEDGIVWVDHRYELPAAIDYLGDMTRAELVDTLSDMCLNVDTNAPIVRGPYVRDYYSYWSRSYKTYCYYRTSTSYRFLWSYTYDVNEDGYIYAINPSTSGSYFDGYHSKFPLPAGFPEPTCEWVLQDGRYRYVCTPF